MNVKQIFANEHLDFQEGESTCGPVTLLNVLHLKGDFDYTENELAKLCDTKDGIGTDPEKMVGAARKLGLEVVEVKQDATLKDVEQHLDSGSFVIINYFHAFAKQGHYGLVSDYDKRAFYFRDCSLGFLRLRREYFKEYWYNEDKTIYGWLMAVK